MNKLIRCTVKGVEFIDAHHDMILPLGIDHELIVKALVMKK